jgi:AraC-like DNA-binding protein
LLLQTDRSVKEISHEVGVEDVSAFSHFFKKREGVSPKAFRRKYSGA